MAVYDGFPGFSFKKYLSKFDFGALDSMSLEILNFEARCIYLWQEGSGKLTFERAVLQTR